ncbi:MAG TPA: FAD-dependent oxidoreductase [Steroidobacteraceae bacterium]|nr:FAD-dependent oxidoreductase [Steroidobacteraceae bacterium]
MKIAVIGSGIAGNVVAHGLYRDHDLTVFEAGDHVGGHSHTHRIEVDGQQHFVDSGFIVYNEQTYPNFTRLLEQLGVASQASSMSFSVRNEMSGLEYNGTTLNSLFAQRLNLLRPSFHRLWRDILRFNRHAPGVLEQHRHELTLGEYVREQGYSSGFVDNYLLPMAAAIWSSAPADAASMPARFLIGFFRNHGMLSVNDRPQWRTIVGGSARYVEKLVAPFRSRIHLAAPVERIRRAAGQVLLTPRGGPELAFDRVFIACHSDQALRMLADASPAEREILGALPYQENEAVLHTDESLLPKRRLAWAAWNYHVPRIAGDHVCVTYNMNILQALKSHRTICLTLNRTEAIDPARILRRVVYHHPVFTASAVAAQARRAAIDGVRNTYYCGAYWRYGFHEDGVVSALDALAHFRQDLGDAQRAVYRTG